MVINESSVIVSWSMPLLYTAHKLFYQQHSTKKQLDNIFYTSFLTILPANHSRHLFKRELL